MKRKAGRVLITNAVINTAEIEDIAYMLKDLVIVRAEQLFIQDAIEYHALCEKFDEVDISEVVPEYKIIFNSDSKEVSYVRISKKGGDPFISLVDVGLIRLFFMHFERR